MAKAKSKKSAKRKTAKKKPAKKTAKRKLTAKKKTAKKATRKLAKKPAKKTVKKAAKKTAKKVSAPIETLLKVGQTAPDFMLPNEAGQEVSLSSLRGKKVVLYFYPKDDTPGCTQESCDYRDSYSRLSGKNVEVFGISRDSTDSHDQFKSKYSLPFSLLADEEGKVCEAYGVWKEKSMYGRNYMGIERTTFLIDEQGSIRKIYPKVSVNGHVDEVIHDIEGVS